MSPCYKAICAINNTPQAPGISLHMFDPNADGCSLKAVPIFDHGADNKGQLVVRFDLDIRMILGPDG
jgi:hypothetical protein